MEPKRPSVIKTLVMKVASLLGWVSFPTPGTPTGSTSIKCENCGLVNPSVWKRCERCNALLGTAPTEPDSPADSPPDLVEKI